MLRNFIQFKKWLRPWVYLFKYMAWRKSPNKHSSSVCLQLGENHASRNVYFFVKSIKSSGRSVFACTNPSFVRRLLKDHYATLVLNEGLMKFAWRKPRNCLSIGIETNSQKKISYDYFALLLSTNPKQPNTYHVPIGMHPLQYHLGLDKRVFNANRNKALFFSGNLKPKFYKDFDPNNFFKMPGRLALFETLCSSDLPFTLNPDLKALKSEIWDGNVIVCDSDCCKVPHEDWRGILAKMDFFLCFPGQAIPYCHNIYEAMSVGTIPILHQAYARLFSPFLKDGLHCFTFSDAEDFTKVCKKALQTDDALLEKMHTAVSDYYYTNLTPEAVGHKITDPKIHKVFLQAEQYSLALLTDKRS